MMTLLGAGLLFSLQFGPVQSYFGTLAANFLSRELRAEIAVGGLYFEPFSSLRINELYVSDQQGDTLLYAPEMKANLDLTQFFQGRLTIQHVALARALFRMNMDQQGNSNLDFLIDYFKTDVTDAQKPDRKITLDLQQATLQNVSFIYRNESNLPPLYGDIASKNRVDREIHANSVDFNDIHAKQINGKFSAIDFSDHRVSARIEGFSLIEQSGFQIRKLHTIATVDADQIELRELDLQTNQSSVRNYLRLGFTDYSNFNDFVHQVDINLELDRSQIASSDIAYFTSALDSIHFQIDLSGSLSGRVDAIHGRNIDLWATPSTRFLGDLSILGLPDIDHTDFNIQMKQLTTNRTDIERLVEELGQKRGFKLPELLEQMGRIQYRGDFRGRYNDFSTAGSLDTDLGPLDTDIEINFREGIPRYAGTLHTKELDIGALLRSDAFSSAGFTGQFIGHHFEPDQMALEWSGQIAHLDFRRYRYQQLETTGSLHHRELNTMLTVRDPHLRMQTTATIGLDPENRSYVLDGTIDHADLRALQFYPDSQATIQGATLQADLKGRHLNDLQGSVTMDNLEIDTDSRLHRVQHLTLTAKGTQSERRVTLESDLINANISGDIDFYNLWPYYQSLANSLIPALRLPSRDASVQDFDFLLEIGDFEPIAAFFAPQLTLAAGTTLSGHFRGSDVEVRLAVPRAVWGETVSTERMRLHLWGNASVLMADLRTGAIRLNNAQPFDSLHLTQRLHDDRSDYQIHLGDAADLHDGHLSGVVRFLPDRSIDIQSYPSSLRLNGVPWQVSQASVTWQNGQTTLRGFDFHQQNQRIRIEGVISTNPNDQLRLVFDDFELRTITPFLPDLDLRFAGTVNGRTHINAVTGRPFAAADLTVSEASINETSLGDLNVNADFDPEQSVINLSAHLLNQGKNTLTVTGLYHLDRAPNNLDLTARFDRLNMNVLQAFLNGLIKDVSGTLSGEAKINGDLKQARFNGTGRLQDVRFNVQYLNTPYRLEGPIRMENTELFFENLALSDPHNHDAEVSGRINLRNPVNPDMGIAIDARNLLVLNTTLRDNPLYYGTAYGTGRFQFRGTPDAMHIEINARTDENTIFHIPLNTSTILGENDFIRFVPFTPQDDTQPTETPKTSLFTGLDMNMDLTVTPGTLANIHTDLGELSGRGNGQINLRISTLGDFEMFGDYQVNSGKFTFTAQDFINKIFEIKEGGNIRWTGKPTDATIALTAFYEQRTSLSPLYDAAGRTPNEQRVLTRAEMDLSGNLLRPTINFGLNFPADPYVRDELQSYLSDANNVNQQALSLIVRRSFLPGSSSDFSRELNTTLLGAGTELAFNQLNNLISQSLNLNFIDLNIRSLNDASASLRFFDDRLVLTGGVTDLRNQRLSDLNVFSNRIATDTELLYLIRKDGRLILRGSNRLNTRHFLLNPSDEYISALGLIYRQEFDTVGEFFRRILLFGRR